METKLVAVGSANPTKINAVKEAFITVFPEVTWHVKGVAVSSGVSDQPMSDEEAVKGAITRAKKAMKKLNAEYGVGLEGGMQQVADQWFDAGWVAIIKKTGEKGVASSLKMPVPPKIVELIKQGTELGFANDIIFKQKNSKHGDGHFGLMTNNAVTRTAGYRDGVIAALSRFIHPELF